MRKSLLLSARSRWIIRNMWFLSWSTNQRETRNLMASRQRAGVLHHMLATSSKIWHQLLVSDQKWITDCCKSKRQWDFYQYRGGVLRLIDLMAQTALLEKKETAPINDNRRDIIIAGLSADSRTVRPGYLFAALPGTKT